MESSLYRELWRFSPLERQFIYPVVTVFWITSGERDHFGQPQKPRCEGLREDAERNGVHPAKRARPAAGTAF